MCVLGEGGVGVRVYLQIQVYHSMRLRRMPVRSYTYDVNIINDGTLYSD